MSTFENLALLLLLSGIVLQWMYSVQLLRVAGLS
jgi:hypothetical protein